jgi:hypothetical protein
METQDREQRTGRTEMANRSRYIRRVRSMKMTPAPAASRAAADLSIFKPEQIDKAEELISDRGIQVFRGTVFLAVSSRGDATYTTDADGCTCPAGDRGIRCYHMAAARILIAA